LREATGRLEAAKAPPKQRLIDADELDEYRYSKRKHFEDLIRANRTKVGNWIKYASWEESQKEFER
jgi:crooked neck